MLRYDFIVIVDVAKSLVCLIFRFGRQRHDKKNAVPGRRTYI